MLRMYSRIMIIIFVSLFFFIKVQCSINDYDEDLNNILEEIYKIVPGSRIVGGANTNIELTPYLAQLHIYDEPLCGASIISQYWLVTAAHCLQGLDKFLNKFPISIITGATFQGVGHHHEIEKFIMHSYYDYKSVDNDIGLIKLKKPIQFNKRQKPIQIGTRFPKYGDQMQITGFGRKGQNIEPSEILKTAFVTVVDQAICKKIYNEQSKQQHIQAKVITKNMFCAAEINTDACEGDSGGPAVINGKLVGIVSWGDECASALYPGVYTQLLNYIEWIEQNTQLNLTHLRILNYL